MGQLLGCNGSIARCTHQKQKTWPHARGLHSFPFQLNLSNSVRCIPNLTHECVLVLLKLSSNVNECKPLPHAAFTTGLHSNSRHIGHCHSSGAYTLTRSLFSST